MEKSGSRRRFKSSILIYTSYCYLQKRMITYKIRRITLQTWVHDNVIRQATWKIELKNEKQYSPRARFCKNILLDDIAQDSDAFNSDLTANRPCWPENFQWILWVMYLDKRMYNEIRRGSNARVQERALYQTSTDCSRWRADDRYHLRWLYLLSLLLSDAMR